MWTDLQKIICFITVSCFIPLGMEAQELAVDTLNGGHLDEVRISALRPSATRSTTSLQVLDNKDIDRIGIQSVSDAVKHFSGVTVKDYGGLGGIKTVSIRSMGATHTGIVYDGVAISDAQTGQSDIGRFSLDNLSQISLSIGQSDEIFQTARTIASAGVLSLKTIQPVFGEHAYSGKAQMKAGSFGFLNPSMRYAQKFNNTFSASIYGDWQKTDGDYPFTFYNGNQVVKKDRSNSDLKSLNSEVNLYSNFQNNGKMNIKAYYYDSERGLPGYIKIDNYYPSVERVKDQNFFTQLTYENSLNNSISIQAQAKYNYTYTDFVDTKNNLENRYCQNEYYASGSLLYTLSSMFSISLAEDVYINTLWNNFPNCPYPERFTSLTALSAQYATPRFSLIGRLLGSFITEKVENGTAPGDKTKLSPAISLSYLPFDETNLRIRASYKNVYRVPTFNELYYYRIGNTNLLPENAIQYNLGLTWCNSFSDIFSYFTASVDAYYNQVHNKIIAIPTLFLPRMSNAGEVEASGLDINIGTTVHLKKDWELIFSGNYSYQKAIDADKSSKTYKNQIPYTPEHSGSGALSIENPWVNISYNFILNGLRYSFSENSSYNRIDGYLDQNISLNKTVKIKKNRLRIQADLLNLANQSYEIIKWYPMPGRSYRFSLSYEF